MAILQEQYLLNIIEIKSQLNHHPAWPVKKRV